ncbi:MAG: hypothetical protein IPO49_03360 [Bacteroidetes bacterium]|nr:hypothetical protein [Bacteroidota bacterium]MBK9541333.1 hypothetical protein [Bacteroidota bacterium]
MKTKQLLLATLFSFSGINLYSQGISSLPIHGNMQFDAQYYFKDSLIGAPEIPEKVLSNGFINFVYDKDNFSAGVRYESYLNPISGFDNRYQGSGIPFRYLTYRNGELEMTAGNFYEQFGSGLIFRSYEERGLGYDNALDGFRIKYKPYAGVYFKGVLGRQRSFFQTGEGIVRGFDGEWNINESFTSRAAAKTQWLIGGSFVSKYQKDQDPTYNLPLNVGASSARISMNSGGWSLSSEYAYKINDPSTSNGFIYKEGQALLVNAGYTRKGLGITLGAKRIDNMGYRSDRYSVGNTLIINYLPALTKNHTYILSALYPYATQPNGEFGFQGEVFYNFKAGTLFGGKYGTDLTVNYSRAQSIEKTAIDTTGNPDAADLGYKSDFFALGKEIYFEDFNIEINHKLSKKLRMILTLMYQNYNKDVVEGRTGFGHVYSNIVILELNYRITPTKNFRTEIQHMSTKQDQQSWAVLLAEYSIAPHWFIAGFDEWNYGNDVSSRQIHYFTGNLGYSRNANRITIGYGRQRAGIFCVGGVCRNVPASSGFTLSITSSF